MAYDILYSEVAPVCFTNIAAAMLPVGTGFDPGSLNIMIEGRLATRENSWFRQKLDKALIVWLKYNYGYIWKKIVGALTERPTDY